MDCTEPTDGRLPSTVPGPVGAGNSAVVVDLSLCGPMLSPRVPHHVPIPGPWMERETPGQRSRPNYGHPHAPTRPAATCDPRRVPNSSPRGGLLAFAGQIWLRRAIFAQLTAHTPPSWRMREIGNRQVRGLAQQRLGTFFRESWDVFSSAALRRWTRYVAFPQVRALSEVYRSGAMG